MSKEKKYNNSEKIKERKYGAITTVFLILILLIAFIGIFKNSFNVNSSSHLVLEPVNVVLSSKNSEEKHSISAEFAISGKQKDMEKFNKDALNLIISNELQNLDYSSISGIDGNENIKKVVLDALKKEYPSIENVYIKNITTDVSIQNQNKSKKNTTIDYLKGFKWSK